MKSKYYVSLAGAPLHNVSSVEDETGREITQYDGVGSGKFNIPDSKDPKIWTIECQLVQDKSQSDTKNSWRASEIFRVLDSAIGNSTDYSRLIVTNEQYPETNVSAMVWVKKYTKKEGFSGIFDVTIMAEEYKPVGIKTTDIPYVARPGKVPVPAKIVVANSKSVYSANKKYGAATSNSKGAIYPQQNKQFTGLTDPKTGKPLTNPNTAKKQTYTLTTAGTLPLTTVQVDESKVAPTYTQEQLGMAGNVWDGPVKSITSTFQWMANGLENWLKNPG
jgi:hypothetical protein